ncbi:MAG TPA: replicative DNA helicase [Bacteroidota bacterium]|nr:replicative DNA helicase [Bacteroidota bacterium]
MANTILDIHAPVESSASQGRVPPQAVDVEKAVLGAMLIDKEAAPKALELLDPTSFYNPTNQKLFQSMVSLFEKGEAIDAVTVVEELRRRGQLNPVEDPAYVTELTMNMTSSANVDYHARIVLEKALMRSLISASTSVASRAYNDTEDALDLLDEAEAAIFQISERRLKKTFTPINRALHETFAMLEEIHGKHSGVTGVPSGFPLLDEKTGGFQNSDLIIVAGRPSQGKTALALSICRNAALHPEKRTSVAIFSLEMSEQQLIIRMLSAEARVNAHQLRTGKLPDENWKYLSRNVGRLAEAKIFIDDTPALSILELRAKARRLKAEHGIGLVVVDYLQLVQGPKSAESREREISMISRSLKALAKELNIPVVALSQLNRALEARSDKRPVLADLRECVTGDTLVILSDGRRVPIRDLVGQQVEVLSVSGEGRIVRASSDAVWSVGRRRVSAVRLASGRYIKATDGHRLYTIKSWRGVKDLRVGDQLAIAKELPGIESQRAAWLLDDPVILAPPTEYGICLSELSASYLSRSGSEVQPVRTSARNQMSITELPRNSGSIDFAVSDLFWDRIVGIEPAGEEEVFDLTVPGTASWLADGIVSHNSGALEQDADVVIFVHRPETYNIKETKDVDGTTMDAEGIAEIIIGKQRNGPTGFTLLTFVKDYAGFERRAPRNLETFLPPPVEEPEPPF